MTLLLVNHHYILPREGCGAIYPVSIPLMIERADYLRSLGYIYIEDYRDYYIERLDDGKAKYFHYTFDDGLREQYDAFEVLKNNGIPPTFYISSEKYTTNEVDLVHLIHFARHKYGPRVLDDLVLSSFKIADETRTKAGMQYRYDSLDSAVCKYFLNFELSQDQAREIILSVLKPLDFELLRTLYMTAEQVKHLCAEGRVGSHAHSHRALGTLTESNLEIELTESKKFFRELGYVVDSISYPYGGPSAIPDPKIVDRKFDFGITMQRCLNNKNTNPLTLNRIDTNDVHFIKPEVDIRLYHTDLRKLRSDT